jgi:hypothetical protein
MLATREMPTSPLLDFAEALRDTGIDPGKIEMSLPTPGMEVAGPRARPRAGCRPFEGVSVRGRLNVGGIRYLEKASVPMAPRHRGA